MRTSIVFLVLLLALSGVASAAEPTLDALLNSGHARVMCVGAHPDDESFPGPILAKASVHGDPILLVVLTGGEGGACERKAGCPPDLGTFRRAEMAEVARLYGARLVHLDFPNVGLPPKGERFPPRQVVAETWLRHGDPALAVARAIRDFRPDVLITFAPVRGATTHPEHQLASRYATAAVRLAAQDSPDLPGAPVRVGRTYYILAKNWLYRLLRADDPFAPTETFDARQDCTPTLHCNALAAERTRPHRSQHWDMGAMRMITRMTSRMFLRRVDPFTEIAPPLEEEKR
jgi:LmbE family N-acetylglucosaminyl deacetylase